MARRKKSWSIRKSSFIILSSMLCVSIISSEEIELSVKLSVFYLQGQRIYIYRIIIGPSSSLVRFRPGHISYNCCDRAVIRSICKAIFSYNIISDVYIFLDWILKFLYKNRSILLLDKILFANSRNNRYYYRHVWR